MYAFIDLETTGLSASKNEILEIAVVLSTKLDSYEVHHFLVKPQFEIPLAIQRLTGLKQADFEQARDLEEVVFEVYSLIQNRKLISHRVAFDTAFLGEVFKKFGLPFAPIMGCTHRMSKRLLPNFSGYGLVQLSSELKLPVIASHRAQNDALATYHLYKHLQQLDNENWMETSFKKRNTDLKLPLGLDKADIEKLPKATGIYIFKNQRNIPIYVGKARNIKSRVLQHFKPKKVSERDQRLYRDVEALDFEPTGSELMALILEDTLIRQHWPALNIAQKSRSFYFNVVLYTDQQNRSRLGIVKSVKRHPLAIKTFFTHYGARRFLVHVQEAFALNAGLVGSFEDPTIAQIPLPEHEQNIKQLVENVKQTETIVLWDRGRTPDERSFVWLENDVPKGFGYWPKNESLSQPQDLEKYSKPLKGSATLIAYIERYMLLHPHAVDYFSATHPPVETSENQDEHVI